MDCNKVQESLGALLDDELTKTEKEEILSHIAECSDCRTALEELKEIKKQFSRLNTQLDGALAESVMKKVYEEAYPKKKTSFFFRHIGTAAALVIIVAIAIFTKFTPKSEEMNDASFDYSVNYAPSQNVAFEKASATAESDTVEEEAIEDAVSEEAIQSEPSADTFSEALLDSPILKAEQPKSADALTDAVVYAETDVETLCEIFDDELIATSFTDTDFVSVKLSQNEVFEVLTSNKIDYSYDRSNEKSYTTVIYTK